MRKAMLGALLGVAALGARADVLLLDGVEMSAQTASSRPTRGMTMERVEAAFGAPSARHAAVGEPPITRWEYPDFVVFFEHQHVIHSVVRRATR